MSKTAREVIAYTDFWLGNDAGDADSFRIALHNVDDIIKALDAAGFVIVPKEPTQEMCNSAVNLGDEEGDGSVSEMDARIIYEQMIEAAVKL